MSHTLPTTLDEVIALAINIDVKIQTRRRGRRQTSSVWFPAPLPWCLASDLPRATAETSSTIVEPMQVGCTSLTPEERERHRKSSRCLYCGWLGHFLATCPLKRVARQ